MSLFPGTRLGPYEVTAQIGAGGMGVVYQATDTNLKRQVAIKILPAAVAADAERLARFTREAQTLASLNHPNIAHIYGLERLRPSRAEDEQIRGEGSASARAGGGAPAPLEESGLIPFLVMELIEGDDLSQRIEGQRARGQGLPLDEVLAIAKQIAEALEAAHDQNIIHRDLKPANIKVRPDGTVKVLDFGLAKALDTRPEGRASDTPGLSQAPTITTPAMTMAGMILGTAAYMAPEQARGKAVDRRADIWAFGAVLFEMLTGARAFPGEDVAETMANVINKEPDWTKLPATLSPTVRTYLRRCLTKNPRQRIADAQDLRLALEGAMDPDETWTPAAASSTTGGRLVWIAAFAVAAVLAAAFAVPAVRHLRERSQAAPPETRLDIVTPLTDIPEDFALSPDGRQIVFVASGDGASRLWVRSLSGTTAQPLIGTEGGTAPFWSPDSRAIGFFSDSRLRRVNIDGGPPQALATITGVGRGGTWNAEDVILFAAASTGPLFRVAAAGGEVKPVTKLERQSAHRWPAFLPDGRHFLFGAVGGAETGGIYLGSLDRPAISRLTGNTADLNVSAGVYLRGPAEASNEGGRLLWVRANTLVAQHLDVDKQVLTGEPVILANPVANNLVLGHGAVSASMSGVVAYRARTITRKQLRWFDRSGKPLGSLGEPDEDVLATPAAAPDGRRAAAARFIQGNGDIWLIDDARKSRFTVDPAIEGFPIWSPDGRWIAFRSRRKGNFDLYQKSSSGAGAEEVLLESAQTNKTPLGWSPGGRFLLYSGSDEKTGLDLYLLPLKAGHASGSPPAEFLKTPFNEHSARFSPDGRWVVHVSNESGHDEVYVRPFREPAVPGAPSSASDGDGQWPASTAGGIYPRWRPDGKEIYYIGPASEMMGVSFSATGDTVQMGKPTLLFPTRIEGGGTDIGQGNYYDVAPDGRFLITTRLESPAAPITLIQHWDPAGKK